MRSRTERRKLPRPARERAQSQTGREIECAVAERFVVAGPRRVEDDVTVQRGCANRLCIDDPRADLDRLDVRGGDRAEITRATLIVPTLFGDMEFTASRGRRQRWSARRHRSNRTWTCRTPASVGTPERGQRPTTETPDSHESHTTSLGVAARFYCRQCPTHRRA